MAGYTLTANSAGFYVNTGTFDPLAIAAGVTVGPSGANGYAIAVGGTLVWTVTNAGTLLGTGHTGFGDGVLLHNTTGTVSNAPGALIEAYRYGVFASGIASVTNQGTIAGGTSSTGIGLFAAGNISNAASAVVTGGKYAIYTGGTIASTVTNAGTVTTGGVIGAWLNAGGSADNQQGGVITGQEFGVLVSGGGGTVVNAGSISDHQLRYGAGVALIDGGTLTNSAGGVIDSPWKGVQLARQTATAAGTVVNYGTVIARDIYGDGAGLWLHGAASVTNASGGIVEGGAFGVVAYYKTTVTNQGTIFGTEYAFKNVNPGNVNRVIDAPGAVFSGIVDANDTIGSAVYSTLELAKGATSGTLSGLGTQFIGFAQTTIDAGATWTLAGGNTLVAGAALANAGTLLIGSGGLTGAGTLVNNGLVEVENGATGTIATPLVTGTGSLQVSTNADLVLNAGSVAATQTVVFADATGTVTLGAGDVAGFNAVIQGFTIGDTIVLSGAGTVTDSIDSTGSVLTLFSNGASIGVLDFVGGITQAEAAQVECFAAGTRLLTDRGELAVEALRAGDRAWSVLGQCFAPIVWVGYRTVDCARHPRPRAVWPVRVSAGAFGAGAPLRDVLLSPDHAVYVDRVLVPVRCLVNGTTVTQEERDSVTYYHVELDRHDVLLADGLAAESYLDTGTRANFANGGGVTALHPDFGAGDVWEMAGCAPLVVTGEELRAIRMALNEGPSVPAEAASMYQRPVHNERVA